MWMVCLVEKILPLLSGHLNNDGSIIIFPAGKVSRICPQSIRDGKGHSGFVRIAINRKSSVLPIFVDGKNSALFYSVSIVAKLLSTLPLVREMFKQARNCVEIRISELISALTFLSKKSPNYSSATSTVSEKIKLANPVLPYSISMERAKELADKFPGISQKPKFTQL